MIIDMTTARITRLIVSHCGGRDFGALTTLIPNIIMHSSICSKRNSGNGIFSILNDTSPGRKLHVEQVEPDLQPATVRNKDQLKIGTWNVRTLYEKGKFRNVQLEMTRLDIDMLGLCEVP